MSLKTLGLAAAILVVSALPSFAVPCGINLELNTASATCPGTLEVQSIDWIDVTIDTGVGNLLDGLSFTAQTEAGSNFNPVLALYSGNQLIQSTGNWGGTQGVPLTLAISDPAALTSGIYQLGIAGRNAFFTPDIADARSTAFFNNGSYTVDAEVSVTAIAAVPLPAGAVLLLTGLGALGCARRNRRAQHAA